MTIFDLDRQVVREYERFARSFTTIQAPDLKANISKAYASGRFWPEPMVQINPRFKGGGRVSDLVASGDLAPGLERIFRGGDGRQGNADGSLQLHKHQLDATPSRTRTRASSSRRARGRASLFATSSRS